MQVTRRVFALVVFRLEGRVYLSFSYRICRSTTYTPLPEDVFCCFHGWISDEKDESVAIQLYFQSAIVMSVSNEEDRAFLVAMGSRIAHLRAVHEITERRLKIAADFYPVHIKDKPHSPAKPVPWIRLRGLWLRQAGFEVNENVKVRVMKGCLVITAE